MRRYAIAVVLFAQLFFVLADSGSCQEGMGAVPEASAAEVRAGTPETTSPTVSGATEEAELKLSRKQLEMLVLKLQQEVAILRNSIRVLETRLVKIEREREQPAISGLRPGETLDSWHTRAHRQGALKIRSDREMEDWHTREHRTRSRSLAPIER